jgi:hypothetical protein
MPISENLSPMSGSLTALQELHFSLILYTYSLVAVHSNRLECQFQKTSHQWEVHSRYCRSSL